MCVRNTASARGSWSMLQSLELGGTGKTVALSFAVPTEVIDVIGKHGANRRDQLKER